MERETGTVKWYSHVRGIGFIVPTTGTRYADNVFFHVVNVEAKPEAGIFGGDSASFVKALDAKGRTVARNVRIATATKPLPYRRKRSTLATDPPDAWPPVGMDCKYAKASNE